MLEHTTGLARSTTLLPEHEAAIRKALSLLNMIGAGEIGGEEAAQKARDVMDEVEAIPVTDVVYQGEVSELNPDRDDVSYPIRIDRIDKGALYVSFGDGDGKGPQLGLLLEVNIGRPCVHVWPEARSETDEVMAIFGNPVPAGAGRYSVMVRADGEIGASEENWEGALWSVRPWYGNDVLESGE